MLHTLLLLMCIGAGVIGGVFFAFSTFVMKALTQVPAPQGIAAMQRINVVVLNPMFLGVFVGTAVLGVTCIVVSFYPWHPPTSYLLLVAGLAYVVGSFGVTMAFNVPRNERLARMVSESAEAVVYWPVYVREWLLWNHVRTGAAVVSAACAALAWATMAGCDNRAEQLTEETTLIEQWRAKRVANLTGENGWLTLAGLYWLQEGQNSFGRAANSALTLNHPALQDVAGVFELRDGHVSFTAAAGGNLTHDGQPVTRIELQTDVAGKPTVLHAGSLRFHAIERAGKMGVRVRDIEHPARKHFQGIDYFPISIDWRINARFEPYVPSKRVGIVNVLGMTEQMESPGALVFNKDGKTWRVDTILESPTDTELFVMFTDATSGRESYGAGRYMYVPKPTNDQAVLDFNKAYNPPCAFTEFATCPLPPRQNRLQLAVTAGEQKYAIH